MAKRRNRIEIIRDILEVIRSKNGKAKPTFILYKSNLSHQMMELYLGEMIEKKFIMENREDESKRTFAITPKGLTFLEKYSTINAFMESFGLE